MIRGKHQEIFMKLNIRLIIACSVLYIDAAHRKPVFSLSQKHAEKEAWQVAEDELCAKIFEVINKEIEDTEMLERVEILYLKPQLGYKEQEFQNIRMCDFKDRFQKENMKYLYTMTITTAKQTFWFQAQRTLRGAYSIGLQRVRSI